MAANDRVASYARHQVLARAYCSSVHDMSASDQLLAFLLFQKGSATSSQLLGSLGMALTRRAVDVATVNETELPEVAW